MKKTQRILAAVLALILLLGRMKSGKAWEPVKTERN